MRTTILLFAVSILLSTSSVFAQPGTLDTTFSKDGKVFTSLEGYNDGANAVAIQTDGKILAAGYSQDVAGKSAFALIRYLTHGRVDSSFGNNGRVTTYFHNRSSVANAMVIQNDGKIILAGYTKLGKFNTAFAIVRYKPDGRIDYSFGLKGKVITDIDSNEDVANAIAIQPDGKILVTGYTYNNDTPSRSIEIAVVRYKPDGRPDSSFGVASKAITDFGGYSKYYPHNDDYGNAIAILPNGKIIVGGYSTPYDGYPSFALVRYKPNGTVDSSFGNNGLMRDPNDFSGAWSMAILPNGKILLAGYTLSLASFVTVAQYKKDGVSDSSFGQNGIVRINYSMYGSNYGKSITVQQNGKIIVAGFSDSQKLELMRFTSRGVLDSSFATNGIGVSDLQSKYDFDHPAPMVTLQKDGKIIVAGNGESKFSLARYNGDPICEDNLSDDKLSKQSLTNISSANVFPNPVKDILYIQHLSSSIKTISLLDLKGKVLQQAVTANNSYFLSVKQLSAGMYFVRINEGEKTIVLKFIKE